MAHAVQIPCLINGWPIPACAIMTDTSYRSHGERIPLSEMGIA